HECAEVFCFLGGLACYCKGSSLITRIDFQRCCRFDDFRILDHTILCRFHNWLAPDDTLARLLAWMNRQFTQKKLTIEQAAAAVIDTTGDKQHQAIEVDDNGQISRETTTSKDPEVDQKRRSLPSR
ncbi:hypothetical protein HMPREF9371_1000, partial [Neisseria shayeganii 871]